MDEGNADVLARLKGPALAIFMAVARDVEPSPDELQTITGWGRGATYAALRRLAKAGWIARSRRGTWRLTAAGRVAWWELVGGRGAGAGTGGGDRARIRGGDRGRDRRQGQEFGELSRSAVGMILTIICRPTVRHERRLTNKDWVTVG